MNEPTVQQLFKYIKYLETLIKEIQADREYLLSQIKQIKKDQRDNDKSVTALATSVKSIGRKFSSIKENVSHLENVVRYQSDRKK